MLKVYIYHGKPNEIFIPERGTLDLEALTFSSGGSLRELESTTKRTGIYHKVELNDEEYDNLMIAIDKLESARRGLRGIFGSGLGSGGASEEKFVELVGHKRFDEALNYLSKNRLVGGKSAFCLYRMEKPWILAYIDLYTYFRNAGRKYEAKCLASKCAFDTSEIWEQEEELEKIRRKRDPQKRIEDF